MSISLIEDITVAWMLCLVWALLPEPNPSVARVEGNTKKIYLFKRKYIYLNKISTPIKTPAYLHTQLF
jgi:hypothetical protein